MNECEKNIELISLAIDGMLSEEETIALENHIRNCEECRNRLIDYQAITSSLESLNEEPPKELHTSIMRAISKEHLSDKETPQKYKFSFTAHLFYAAVALAAVLFIIIGTPAQIQSSKNSSEANSTNANIKESSDKLAGSGLLFDYSQNQSLTSLRKMSIINSLNNNEKAMANENFSDNLLEDAESSKESYDEVTMATEQSAMPTKTENKEFSASTENFKAETENTLKPYLNKTFSFIIFAQFENKQQLQNCISSLFANYSYEYIAEYDAIFITVENADHTISDISVQLPNLGASCEMLSDESHEWYNPKSPQGLIILLSEN